MEAIRGTWHLWETITEIVGSGVVIKWACREFDQYCQRRIEECQRRLEEL